jgi:RNA polymerase primary sigma factor
MQLDYLPEDQKISDIVKYFDASVRLQNVLKHPDFPYQTLGELIMAPNLEGDIRKVQNAGAKTARELAELLEKILDPAFREKWISDPASKTEVSSPEKEMILSLFAVLELFEFPKSLLQSDIPVSVRLGNILHNIQEDETRSCKTLADCARDFKSFSSYVLRFRNSGRKSFDELRDLLLECQARILVSAEIDESFISYFSSKFYNQNYLAIDLPDSQEDQKDKLAKYLEKHSSGGIKPLVPWENIPTEISENTVIEEIRGIVDARVFSVLSKRFGFLSEREHTLEEIANSYSLTRERIRQLEKRGLTVVAKRKKGLLDLYLKSREAFIRSKLWDDASFMRDRDVHRRFLELAGLERLSILALHGSERDFLERDSLLEGAYWIPANLESGTLALLKAQIEADEKIQSVKDAIKEILVEFKWPVSVESICTLLPMYSSAHIESCLRDQFDARVVDGNIMQICNGLTADERLTIILCNQECGLPTKEIANIHLSMFGSNLTDGIIINTLGQSGKALITARGTYDLYRNLKFTEVQLSEIRDEVFEFVNRKQRFLSAKIVYAALFSGRAMTDKNFNPYMLYGIIQDDERFLCKRGLMIGLRNFVEEKFIGLRETIFSIVDDHGPLTIAAIQRALSDHREVFGSTISMMLENSENYIKSGRGNYDRIDRVIGNDIQPDELRMCMELMLADRPLDIVSVQSNLGSLEIRLPTRAILSLLQKWGNFSFENRKIVLDQPSPEVAEYEICFRQATERSPTPDQVRKHLEENLKESLHYLIPLDSRLNSENPADHSNNTQMAPLVLSGFKVSIGLRSDE